MALIVEDGSGLPDSNSYIDASEFKTYADTRGVVYEDDDAKIEQALIRATSWLDASYRARWPGAKTNGRSQALSWPRTEASDADDEEIAANEIPQEVLDATAEAAIRELTGAGSLSPDLERGGDIRRLKAGSVEIEYGATASARTTFSAIDGILAGLLVGGSAGGPTLTATAVRA